jgi:DNA polymerase-1
MIKGRFVLIDAFALIHRAYHALPPLTTKDGHQVNAVYGFASALLSSIEKLEPEYLAVGFDLPEPTLRHKEYVEYKAHRAPAPDELVEQIPYVKDVLKTFNIPIVAVEGYEGEDVIATIVAKVKRQKAKDKMEYIIVTGDMDCLQLIDEQTKVYSMARPPRLADSHGGQARGVNQAVMYDKDKVFERYGLKPSQFVDFKALKGDPSDNIPGVPGIGDKGAASLIKQFGSLGKLYQEIQKAKGKKQKEIKLKNDKKISEKMIGILLENKEQANLSQKLSKIDDSAPIEFELSSAKVHDFDYKKVVRLLNKLGFRSLIKRLPESSRKESAQKLF